MKKYMNLFKGDKNMEAVILPKVNRDRLSKQYAVANSPWEELGKWCSSFAKEKDLTVEEAMAMLERVRAEDEGSCRY